MVRGENKMQTTNALGLKGSMEDMFHSSLPLWSLYRFYFYILPHLNNKTQQDLSAV